MFDINEIKSKVHGLRGLQVPNLCAVKFKPNEKQINFGRGKYDTLTLLGYKFAIPTLNLVTSEIRRAGFGPNERRVTNFAPSTVAIEFFLDNDNNVLDFLNEWAINHVNYQSGNLQEVAKLKNGIEANFGEVGYYDNYAMGLDIEVYDPAKNKIITYQVIDASILSIGTIELGWQQNNELTTLSVQLAYRAITPVTSEPQTPSEAPGGGKGMNLFQFINKMKGAVEVVKSFERPSNVQDALNLINNAKTLGSGFSSGSEADRYG